MKNKLIQITEKHLVKNAMGTVSKMVLEHKGTILTGITISSNAAGIAMTYKNSPLIHEIIFQTKKQIGTISPDDPLYEVRRKEAYRSGLKQIIPLAAPIIFFFTVSTAAAIVNQKQNEAKISTLTAALSMAQSTIAEADMFKAEATKELGEEKVQQIEKDIEKKQLDEARKNSMLPFIRENEFLCLIPSFGYVFSGTPDRLENAMLKVNTVIEDNGEHGRGYGRESENGNEIVTWYDIFNEIGVENIPDYADHLAWEAGQVKTIKYRIEENATEWGQTYYTLLIYTNPQFI